MPVCCIYWSTFAGTLSFSNNLQCLQTSLDAKLAVIRVFQKTERGVRRFNETCSLTSWRELLLQQGLSDGKLSQCGHTYKHYTDVGVLNRYYSEFDPFKRKGLGKAFQNFASHVCNCWRNANQLR